MKEYPILFSGEMVQAILDGRKTQTRRVIKDQSLLDRLTLVSACYKCPYGSPGSALWVRETWRAIELDNGNDGILYKADNHFKSIENSQAAADLWCDVYDNHKHGDKWRPSIFMPRWASRITLEITNIQVERLNDISDDDAVAEGIKNVCHCGDYIDGHGFSSGHSPVSIPGWAIDNFSGLWDSINAKRGYPWESNPWVWVVGFKMVKP